jgi:hypothetical protein
MDIQETTQNSNKAWHTRVLLGMRLSTMKDSVGVAV